MLEITAHGSPVALTGHRGENGAKYMILGH